MNKTQYLPSRSHILVGNERSTQCIGMLRGWKNKVGKAVAVGEVTQVKGFTFLTYEMAGLDWII